MHRSRERQFLHAGREFRQYSFAVEKGRSGRRARESALSGRCQTGFAFFGNDEEGRSRIEFQVTLKLTPKIGHNSKVDQRKRQNSQPITRNLAWRFPSLKKFHQRTQARTIKKSKDGVIALVIADRKMVHIVSQAHNEVVAHRYRRDLVERNLIFNKQIPKNCNVNFDRWDVVRTEQVGRYKEGDALPLKRS